MTSTQYTAIEDILNMFSVECKAGIRELMFNRLNVKNANQAMQLEFDLVLATLNTIIGRSILNFASEGKIIETLSAIKGMCSTVEIEKTAQNLKRSWALSDFEAIQLAISLNKIN